MDGCFVSRKVRRRTASPPFQARLTILATIKLRSSKEYGAFWQCDEFDLRSVVESDATVPERDASPPPLLEPVPSPGDAHKAPPSSTSQIGGKEGPKLTKTQRDNLRKRRNRDPTELSALHIDNSIAFQTQDFVGTSAPHEGAGYKGMHDCGVAYDFLDGSYPEQVAQLQERGYDFLDPPPEYVP